MQKRDNVVTCMYCEHFKYTLCKLDRPYNEFDVIPCVKKGVGRCSFDEICEDFILRQGIYTKKYHPDK